jgi:hypothetical protein
MGFLFVVSSPCYLKFVYGDITKSETKEELYQTIEKLLEIKLWKIMKI